MLVEFIGSTGVGKSTMIGQLVHLLRQHGRLALTSDQFVLRQYGLGLDRIHWQPLRSVLVDLLVLPWCIRFALAHTRLCALMVTIAWRDIELPWFKLNVLRNIAKQMGIYAFLRGRVSPADIVLLDEGLVHQAHSLFVHPNHAPRRQELLRFVREVPPPDLLVLVEGPSREVLNRTLQRGHPRVPGARIAEVDTFLTQAHDVFAHVVELVEERVETARIWNGDRTETDTALRGLVARLTLAHAG